MYGVHVHNHTLVTTTTVSQLQDSIIPDLTLTLSPLPVVALAALFALVSAHVKIMTYNIMPLSYQDVSLPPVSGVWIPSPPLPLFLSHST